MFLIPIYVCKSDSTLNLKHRNKNSASKLQYDVAAYYGRRIQMEKKNNRSRKINLL